MTEPTKQDSGPRLGIFDDISNEDYQRGPGISKTGLDRIAISPEHFITEKRCHRVIAGSVIGSPLHKLVLEPDTFENEYVMMPAGAPKRPTKTQLASKKPSLQAMESIAYWQQFDEDHKGQTIISTTPGVNLSTGLEDPFWKPSDWCMIHRMRDSISMHETASILLDPGSGRAETSCYWLDKDDDYGVRDPTFRLCKCRPDFINDAHNLMVDLKSAVDASYTGFRQHVAKYRYFVQAAWYTSGYYQSTGKAVQDFIFVVVEKQPPYGVGIYKLGLQEKRAGRALMLRDLDTYDECLKSGEWPCYPSDIRDLELSPWQMAGNIS